MFRDITNIPHVPRARALLDSRAMIRNPVRVFESYRARFGPTFSFHFGGAKPTIVSTSPSFIQHVLQKNRANYHMSDIRVERMAEFQGHGLLNSHGEAWLRQRRYLSQGFKRSRLAALLPVQQRVIEEFVADFDVAAERGPVDMHRAMTRLTFRLVGTSIVGSQLTEAEIEQLGSTITAIQGFMVRQIVQPYMIPWFRISGASRRNQRLRIAGDAIIRDYIERRRRATGESEGDMLELMLETPYPDTGETMSPEQMLIESMQLLVAGNETSPTTLAWTLYLLGRHRSFIAAIREEVDDVLGDGPVTFMGLHRLHLTLRVLEEAMRLYPPFWMIDRVALANDEVDGIRIPAGTIVVPYIYGTHHNPEVWENPDVFDPSRFEEEVRKDRHPFAHIPFGGGPRTCIGSNLAILQMLLILAILVRRYDFELTSSDGVDIAPMMILRPKGGIEMRVRRNLERHRPTEGGCCRPVEAHPRPSSCDIGSAPTSHSSYHGL
jgi:cytochrome P450